MKTYGKRFKLNLPKARKGWVCWNMGRGLRKQLNIMTGGDIR